MVLSLRGDSVFLSTLSLRRATVNRQGRNPACVHFYPRSPCGERLYRSAIENQYSAISIHALLAESDYTTWLPAARQKVFLSTLSLRRATKAQDEYKDTVTISIHALLAESDPLVSKNRTAFSVFLSTLSLRRATLCWCWGYRLRCHFYPRSPCGERPSFIVYSITGKCISIHALLAESDDKNECTSLAPKPFLSTLSLRRATHNADIFFCNFAISIHALLAESDLIITLRSAKRLDFYPRSPCGERPRKPTAIANTPKFLSTLSLRRATFSVSFCAA